MKRINLYFVLGAAVLTALAVAACAKDRSGPAAATDPAVRIAAAVAEGAQVRATVHDAVEIPGGFPAQGDGETRSAEAVVSMPPSPRVVMFLLEWKLKVAASPRNPAGRPLYRPPTTCAASAMTCSPRSCASAVIASMSQHWP